MAQESNKVNAEIRPQAVTVAKAVISNSVITNAESSLKPDSDHIGAYAEANDPVPGDVIRWFDLGGGTLPLRVGNEVRSFIRGKETFEKMVEAIKTAKTDKHFIYLAGWWLTGTLELVLGDTESTIYKLFTNASLKHKVQIRAMLWDQPGTQNNEEVEYINNLPTGTAVRDNRTLNLGCHHQKILIVYGGEEGKEELIAFCGGVDINPDRIQQVNSQPGSPLHDVHCRIKGLAAYDLLRTFAQRWNDYQVNEKQSINDKGVLLGSEILRSVPLALPKGRQYIQVGRTYPNGNLFGGLGGKKGCYEFAPDGEETASRIIRKAIGNAQKFIYIEDQYLYSLAERDELIKVLDKTQTIEHVTILIPHPSLMEDLTKIQVNYRRQQFIDNLRKAGGNKVRVFYLSPPGAPHTYVHAKIHIIDDRFAVIGSANCNRRGWTHDSEVVAGIYSAGDDHFVRDLRVRLWAEHLNMNTPEGRSKLIDGVTGAAYWLKSPVDGKVALYNENFCIESVHTEYDWNTNLDPEGLKRNTIM